MLSFKLIANKINTANLGEEVYVVVTTSNFQDKKIWLNVRQGKEQGIDTENCAIELSDNDKEFYRPEAVVGAYANESKITNSNDFKDWAIFKFKIGGKNTKGYADKLEKLTNKKTKLCLIIDAHNPNGIPSNHIGYEGYDGKLDHSEEPNCWLDEDGKWFELGKNKKAPWMEIALKEYNTYKTKREDESPLKEKIIDHYHKSTVLGAAHHGKETQWGDDTSWCASFINWCFNQLKDYENTNKNPKKYYNSQAYSWKHENWKNGDKSEPFYGAVAVTNFSHTGFVAGKSKTGKIVILGGNQDGAQKRSLKERICYTAIDKTAIISYAKPKGYESSESEKQLSIIDITASDNFSSTR